MEGQRQPEQFQQPRTETTEPTPTPETPETKEPEQQIETPPQQPETAPEKTEEEVFVEEIRSEEKPLETTVGQVERMERTPQELRQFSKEHSPEERREVALEIRSKRKEFFNWQKELSERTQELTQKIQETSVGVANAEREIEAVERTIAEKKRNKLQELLNHFQIRGLERELEEKSIGKAQFEERYQTAQNMVQELRQLSENREKVDESRRLLSDFYKSQREKLGAFEIEAQTRDVANIIDQYRVIFIHGIHPSFVPGGNSLLNKDVDWQTKLKILLSLEPTISSSTIRQGDTHKKMWARMGVILNGGSVISAHVTDAGTIAEGLKRRSDWVTKQNDISGRIQEAITSDYEGYNELVVENPRIAGFYVCLDSTGSIIKNDLVPAGEIMATAKELGMPVYAIQEGAVYSSEYGPETGRLVRKEEISPGKIAQMSFRLGEPQKEQMLEELFSDSPFKIKSPEVEYMDSRSYGRETFIEINTPKNVDRFSKGEYSEYKRTAMEWGAAPSDIERIRVIAEFPRIGSRVQYLLTEKGQIYRKRIYNTGETHMNNQRDLESGYRIGSIHIGFFTHNLGESITDSEAYLSGMEKSIEKITKERDGVKEEKYKGQIRFLEEWLNKLAFHMYGFGDQADQWGDAETKNRAFEIADRVLSKVAYEEILSRRMGTDGKFRITREDLN